MPWHMVLNNPPLLHACLLHQVVIDWFKTDCPSCKVSSHHNPQSVGCCLEQSAWIATVNGSRGCIGLINCWHSSNTCPQCSV